MFYLVKVSPIARVTSYAIGTLCNGTSTKIPTNFLDFCVFDCSHTTVGHLVGCIVLYSRETMFYIFILWISGDDIAKYTYSKRGFHITTFFLKYKDKKKHLQKNTHRCCNDQRARLECGKS